MSAQIVIEKLRKELFTSGCLNTPEPEELKEIRVEGEIVKANGAFHSIKAKRQRPTGNPTFHKYKGSDLWSIKAGRIGACAVCHDIITVGQEITLFDAAQGWAHMSHAVDQPSPDQRLNQ
jgi:hypothetical protein